MPKEIALFEKIINRAKSLATGSADNEVLTYALCCKVWSWKQQYRNDDSPHRVSQKAYRSLLEELSSYEDRIKAGAYEDEAKKAVAEVREWLELAIGYRVPAPSNGKCRVF